MQTTIATLAASIAAIEARCSLVCDRSDLDAEARAWAGRLCAEQRDAIETAILLEPPAAPSDLRLIAFAGINKLHMLEGDPRQLKQDELLAFVEQMTTALEHIAAHRLLDDGTNCPDERELGICRDHAGMRAVPTATAADQRGES